MRARISDPNDASEQKINLNTSKDCMLQNTTAKI